MIKEPRRESRDYDEVKINLTISLLKHLERIISRLENLEESGMDTGFHKEIVRASLDIALLLRRVKLEDNEKEMIELKKNITLENYANINPNYIFKAYAVINDFMNDTYFADYHRAKPKYKDEGHI